MSNNELLEDYATAALFIYHTKSAVNLEDIEKVMQAINKPFLPKLGKMFCLDSNKYEEFLQFSASSGSSAAAAPQGAIEEKVEDVKEASEESEDVDMDAFF